MPPKKPSQNKRGAAHRDQQPSLLEQLEFDEERPHENDRDSDHGSDHENPLQGEDPGDEAEDQDSGKTTPETAYSQPGAAEGPDGKSSEALQRAYARYVEIVNETYNSRFSDGRRQAAFREAAKAHRVRITDLKRYSTAVALNIPYHNTGGADPEHSAASDQDTDASGTNPLESDASESG